MTSRSSGRSRGLNVFTGAVIAVLVILSVILTLSVLFPENTGEAILAILAGGGLLAIVTTVGILMVTPVCIPIPMTEASARPNREAERQIWRMPPLDELPPARLTYLNCTWLIVLRAYLVVAGGLVLMRIVLLAAKRNRGVVAWTTRK